MAGKTQGSLDEMIVYIELTLIAIVQGVAFFLLIEAAHEVVVASDYRLLPYVAAGFLMVVLFWSVATFHTITMVGWPFDIGHNVLYMLATLLQSMLYLEISRPLHWWALSSLFSLSIGLLFWYDLRMLRIRRVTIRSPSFVAMLDGVEREQLFQLRVIVPLIIVGTLLATGAIYLWPDTLLADHGHVALGTVQALGLALYGVHVARWVARFSPQVGDARLAREDEETNLPDRDVPQHDNS